jgi:hypothetical protein
VTVQHGSVLATRRGRLTLLLLCAVQFLDVADSSIMNVALPSIRRDLGFRAASGRHGHGNHSHHPTAQPDE